MSTALDVHAIDDFLAPGRRIAVVGASADPKQFGNVVYRELRDHGHQVVAVHPRATEVAGDACYPDLAAVPGPLDGVLVMVRHESADVVRQAAALGIRRVWLFRGAGPGAVNDDALVACHEAGMSVVAGACPLMFLPPVRGVHRIHRGFRRLCGALPRSGDAALG